MYYNYILFALISSLESEWYSVYLLMKFEVTKFLFRFNFNIIIPYKQDFFPSME